MKRETRISWMAGMLAVLTATGVAPLAAQDAGGAHTVDREAVWGAVAEKADGDEAEREAIRSVLDRPEVEAAAESHGIDLTRARDGVATLEGEELRRVSERARQLDEVLAGGDDTVVISTTTIIIALLVLIIILVA